MTLKQLHFLQSLKVTLSLLFFNFCLVLIAYLHQLSVHVIKHLIVWFLEYLWPAVVSPSDPSAAALVPVVCFFSWIFTFPLRVCDLCCLQTEDISSSAPIDSSLYVSSGSLRKQELTGTRREAEQRRWGGGVFLSLSNRVALRLN